MHQVSNVELFIAQDGKCFYCGKIMATIRANPSKKNKLQPGWTIDHFYPKSHGNGKTLNKVMCHMHCNQGKADRPPSIDEVKEFKKLYDKIASRRIAVKIYCENIG